MLNVPDPHHDDSMNSGRPIGENRKINQHFLGQVRWQEVDCLWRGIVPGGRWIVTGWGKAAQNLSDENVTGDLMLCKHLDDAFISSLP